MTKLGSCSAKPVQWPVLSHSRRLEVTVIHQAAHKADHCPAWRTPPAVQQPHSSHSPSPESAPTCRTAGCCGRSCLAACRQRPSCDVAALHARSGALGGAMHHVVLRVAGTQARRLRRSAAAFQPGDLEDLGHLGPAAAGKRRETLYAAHGACCGLKEPRGEEGSRRGRAGRQLHSGGCGILVGATGQEGVPPLSRPPPPWGQQKTCP